MDTTPPDAPPRPGPETDTGPRVGRDEIRDLARLRRSGDDRKIAGVAGGIARHLDIDPIIPRVLLAVLVFFGGAGILLYAVIWLVVPVEGTDSATVRLDDRSRSIALMIVGVLAALALVGDSFGGWGPPWPLVVAGVVVLVVMTIAQREPKLHPLVRQPGPTYAPADPTDPTTTSAAQATPAAAWVPPAPVAKPRDPRRAGPVLFWYALAVIVIGVGVLGMVDLAGADVPGSAYPAVALGTCAALLVLGAFWGRAGGLILLGLLSAVATAGATAADEVDAGRVASAPTSAAGVQDGYELTFGEIDLDLTDVADLDALDGRTVLVRIEVAGHVQVTLPDGLDVVVESDVAAGQRRFFGDELGEGSDTTAYPADRTSPTTATVPELRLVTEVPFGEIEIDREGAR